MSLHPNEPNEVRPGKRSDLVRGQTLVEMVFALGVAVLVIVALVAATTVAVRNAQFAKSQSLAAKYAVEGMEYLRFLRDSQTTNFFTTLCSGTENISGGFTRSFRCENATPPPGIPVTKVKATVTVSWTDARGTHNSTQISYFTKWQ